MNSSIFKRNGNETLSSSTSSAMSSHLPEFPYASTPAVSMLVKEDLDFSEIIEMKLQRANMKLPVGSLANADSSKERLNQSISKPRGGKKRQNINNITVRDRYNFNATETSIISPIIPATETRNNMVQLTEPRGSRKLFNRGEEKSNEESGLDSASSKTVFPYPSVELNLADPGDMLCQCLKTLNAYNIIEGEKQRLYGQKKRKEKPEEKVSPYDFQTDTFTAVNCEAANYALHLIFTTINAKETEQRFRDCWPVYEKKLEGVFRRVALDWVKQIVDENPLFFRELRTEAIGGLLVNPGGDRFISFLRQLCRFALYTLANRMKGLVKKQVLLPPAPTSDPEVRNRQMHLLYHRARKLGEALPERYKALIQRDMAFSLRLRVLDENFQHNKREGAIEAATLMSYVNNYPEIFGNPTEDELQARESVVSSMKLHVVKEQEHFNDILYERLLMRLKKQAEEIYKPVSLLHDMLEDYGSLWRILEMDKSTPAEIDCTKLPPHQLCDSSETPSLNYFIKSFLSMVDDVVSSDCLNVETPEDILREFEASCRRFSFLEIMMTEVHKGISPDIGDNAGLEMKRNVLKLRLGNFDWSLLSRVHENGITHLLDMTPLRIYDINRTSGKTPGINNFLDSSSSSSSGEHHQTSIVKRRNAQMMRAKTAKRTSLQRSVSDVTEHRGHLSSDTTDGHIKLKSTSGYSSSVKVDSTPLSSTQNQSGGKGIRSSSLFRDSSTETPVSAVSVTTTSFRMNKSVSFGEIADSPTTITGESSSVSTKMSMRHQRKSSSRFSSGPNSFNIGTPSMLDSPLGSGSRDAFSRLSFASSTGTPIGLDNSTRERLNKLMESVAVNNHIRSSRSLSPIASSEIEADATNASGDNTQLAAASPTLDNSGDTKKDMKEDNDDKEEVTLNEVKFSSLDDADFQDISIIEDLEGIKGIMETSYVEFFRNSDSDD